MSTGVKYRKHLGQHFLRDTGIAKKIIDSMEINSDDTILEIGPGDGALTVFLLNSLAEKVICVETDSRLLEILKKKFGDEKRFILIGEDILKFDFSSISLSGRKIRVVGNIPYYITTPILFYLLDNSYT